MITRRGWALIGSAAGLFVAGRILGLVQLAVLAFIALLTIASALVWVRLRDPRLDGHRELKERLQVGVQGRVDIVVRAGSPTATLAVNDAFDGGRRAARLLLAPMHAGEEARAAYRFPTDRRGRYEVGPLRVTVADPFALGGAHALRARHRGSDRVPARPRRAAASGVGWPRSRPRAAASAIANRAQRRVPHAARLRARRRPPSRALAIHRAPRPLDDAPERSSPAHSGAGAARREARARMIGRRSSARSRRARRS